MNVTVCVCVFLCVSEWMNAQKPYRIRINASQLASDCQLHLPLYALFSSFFLSADNTLIPLDVIVPYCSMGEYDEMKDENRNEHDGIVNDSGCFVCICKHFLDVFEYEHFSPLYEIQTRITWAHQIRFQWKWANMCVCVLVFEYECEKDRCFSQYLTSIQSLHTTTLHY